MTNLSLVTGEADPTKRRCSGHRTLLIAVYFKLKGTLSLQCPRQSHDVNCQLSKSHLLSNSCLLSQVGLTRCSDHRSLPGEDEDADSKPLDSSNWSGSPTAQALRRKNRCAHLTVVSCFYCRVSVCFHIFLSTPHNDVMSFLTDSLGGHFADGRVRL